MFQGLLNNYVSHHNGCIIQLLPCFMIKFLHESIQTLHQWFPENITILKNSYFEILRSIHMFHINLKTKRVHVKYELQEGIYNENKIENKKKTNKKKNQYFYRRMHKLIIKKKMHQWLREKEQNRNKTPTRQKPGGENRANEWNIHAKHIWMIYYAQTDEWNLNEKQKKLKYIGLLVLF